MWYYNLLPQGQQKIICPFHADENPSLLIDFSKGYWYCFGCGLSGDAAKFVYLVEKKNGLNDLQAYQKYLRILKSEKCSELNLKTIPKRKRINGSRELYNIAYDDYHGLKKVDWRITVEEEQKSAFEYMNKRGFSAKTLNKVKAKVTYNPSYEIMFPMLDNGKFRGWVCRTTVSEIEKKRKYLYNEGFSRASTLVGEYGSVDYVIVVEGYMDRLKFIQFGVENVVAILGWKMSAQQIEKLKSKGITKIISALDNDVCGKRGTEYLKGFFDVTRFRYLKGIKDPGEMTQETFDRMYNKTMSDFRRKYNGTD